MKNYVKSQNLKWKILHKILPFIQHFIRVMVLVKMNNVIQTIHFCFNSFINHHFAEEFFSFFRFQIKLKLKFKTLKKIHLKMPRIFINTVWKFRDFSITLHLCELNFGNCICAKSAF